MPFSAFTAEPTGTAGPTPTAYSAPSNENLAAVAVTVSVVGVLMAVLITWLAVRLRRAAHAQSAHVPIVTRRPTNASHTFRPSLAPSEASSKFGFARKSLRLSRKRKDGSWDFADPDPVSLQKDGELVRPFHRPAPLAPIPAYAPPARRASTHKDELGPRTPTTPATPASVNPPPPAYCRESAPWPVSPTKPVLPC